MKNLIVDRTILRSFNVPKFLQPFLHELPEFTRMMTTLEEEEHSAMVAMEGEAIIVAGFRSGVSKIANMISELIKEKLGHFTPLKVPIDRMTGLCLQENTESLNFWALSVNVTCALAIGKMEAKVVLSPTKQTQPDWKDKCQKLLFSYMNSKFQCTIVSYPEEISQEVMTLLVSKKKCINFEMDTDSPATRIVGEKSEVEAVLKKIDNIKSEKEISKTKKMSVRQYDFFTQLVQHTIPVQVEPQGM